MNEGNEFSSYGSMQEIVGGIQWRYEVKDGQAIIDSVSAPVAIDIVAKGVIVVPARLGGYPTGIGGHAFCQCKQLKEVRIPAEVMSIAPNAFEGCKALQRIEVSIDNVRYTSQDGILLCKDNSDLIVFPEGMIDSFSSADSNPMWKVRERLLKVLGEREESFQAWTQDRSRSPDGKVGDDVFFFDGILSVLPHITILDGFRLAAMLQSDLGAARAVFIAVGNGQSLPLEDALCLDGTSASYWEAAVLLFEAAQFYLFWHANYMRMEMVTSLRSFLREYWFCGYSGRHILNELLQKFCRQLCRMDFNPKVSPYTHGCEVCYTTFAPFGGFARHRLGIRKKKVGISISASMEERVPYHCSIMF